MTSADLERFGVVLAGLAEVFGEAVSEPKFNAYFAALHDLSIEEIEKAGQILLGTNKFFPKPVEFREALAGTSNDRADAAWRTLVKLCVEEGHYPSLWITDGALAFAIDHLGGWIEAQAKLNEASPEMVRAYEKQFIASYRLGEKRDEPARYFAGQIEYTNRGQVGSMQRAQLNQIPLLVCALTSNDYRRLSMWIDIQTGALSAECRVALESGDVVRYLPKPARITQAMLPPITEETAKPEEIGTIRSYVENFIGKMANRRIAATSEAREGKDAA